MDDCPNLSVSFVRNLLETVGEHLRYLKIGWNMPKLTSGSLYGILFPAPMVSELTTAMEFLDMRFVYPDDGRELAPHPSECITFESHPRRESHAFLAHLGDFLSASVSCGRLSHLRRLRLTRLGLEGDITICLPHALRELGEILEMLEQEENKGERGRASMWILGVWDVRLQVTFIR